MAIIKQLATALTSLVLGLHAAAAFAEDPPPPTNAAEVTARFKAADKNGDGKLTYEEAQAGMPRIAAAFDKIDVDNKGYVTLDQILTAIGYR